MFKNYLKVSLRTLRRQKEYTLINVLGLALGIACSLLILLFVRDEWTHDAFHENADSIYRVNMEWKSDGVRQRWADTPVPLAPALADAFPEIEHATRYYLAFTAARHEQVTEYEMLSFVDASFFQMFSFPFLHGAPQAAFPNPSSVVITEGVAEKFYGSTDVVGQVLLIKLETGFEPFTNCVRTRRRSRCRARA
jgi:putative ABC transport system permease protein